MLGVLPALFVAACIAALGSRHRPLGNGDGRPPLRDAIVISLLMAGAWSAFGGELLSLFEGLRFWPLLVWWAVPTAALAAVAIAHRESLRGRLAVPSRPDPMTLVLTGATGVLLLVTGLIALLTPPNNFDALQYHMPRQLMWLQQASLAHYPVHDLRQLEFPPMAESAGVQMMILAGDDHWANMVSWTAFVGCVVLASAVARDLGAGARGQSLSALLVATGTATLQHAVNPKNDLAVAFWAHMLAYFAVRIRVDRTCRPARVVLIGLALGLLLYTKGTGYLLVPPLGALLAVWMLMQMGLRAIPAGLLIGVIAAGINAGHWWRNYDAFGHPLGRSADGTGYRLTNEVHTPAAIISNIVRNIAQHTPLPGEWGRPANEAQERWISGLHRVLGIDPSDPRTTTPDNRIFDVRWRIGLDGCAPSPVHLILAVLAPIGLWRGLRRVVDPPWRGRRPCPTTSSRANPEGDGPALALYAASVGAFLVFCFVLKWQPWHARLHIPMFILFAPVCGFVMARAPGGPLKGIIVFGAVFLATLAILYNTSKPLVGEYSLLRTTRGAMRFRGDASAYRAATAAAAVAAEFRPRIVGLSPDRGGFQYSVQRVARDHITPTPRIVSARPSLGPPPDETQPEVILGWNETGAVLNIAPGRRAYVSVAQFLPITVYAREDLVATVRSAETPRQSIEAMAFIGWRALEGLGPMEGPFPKMNLPVVCWALGLRTRLEFDNDSDTEAELIMECRRAASRDQTMEVLVNGERVYRFEFASAAAFTLHRIPLRPKAGVNQIEIRYSRTDRTIRGEDRAVLYRRIQVLPRPAPPEPPGDAEATSPAELAPVPAGR